MIAIAFLTVSSLLQSTTSSHYPSTQSSGCGGTNTQTLGSSQSYTMTVNDPYQGVMQRHYIVHLPPGYDNNAANGEPVVFALPGFLTSAQEFEDGMKINGNSDMNNYIIVYAEGNEMPRANGNIIYNWNDLSSSVSPGPAGPTCDPDNLNNPITVAYNNECGKGWRQNPAKTCIWTRCDVDDLKFIRKLADKIEDDFCIDTSREYIIGFSNGGMMTQRVACEMNDRFAAAVTLHGQLHIGFNCAPTSGPKMPMLNVHARNDQLLPGIATEEVNLVNGVPGTGTMAAVSRSGWYFLPVEDVQDAFADFNECDKTNGQLRLAFDSIGQEVHNWRCTAWRKDCSDAPAAQCEYTWRHLVYAVEEGEEDNFIMPGVWEFLSKCDRINGCTFGEDEETFVVDRPISPDTTTWTITLSSSTVWILGSVLTVILLLNIGFLCCLNCCGRKKAYIAVKRVDSEFYDSEQNPINA